MMQHLLTLRDKLAGRTLPKRAECINMLQPYRELFFLLRESLLRSEVSMCRLMGFVRCGKKTLLNKVMHDVEVLHLHPQKRHFRVISLAPENCYSLPAAVTSLYEQIFPQNRNDDDEQWYLTTAQKMEQIYRYITQPNQQPTVLHLQRFARIEKTLPALVNVLLEALETSVQHPLFFVASDTDMVFCCC